MDRQEFHAKKFGHKERNSITISVRKFFRTNIVWNNPLD
jgi:hypothetical protein